MKTVSIIISAYRSEATLERCLESLRRQTFTDFEVVLVDSSPDSHCQQIAENQFPEFRCIRHPERLTADQARNLGYQQSGGTLVAAIDADVYSAQNWLAELVAAHNLSGGLAIGAVACFGNRWLDLGAHLCKFDKWLAGNPPSMLKEGPSANMLLSRQMIERAGGFMGPIQGDTDLCWRLRKAGFELYLAPEAVVEHHHLHTWRSLLSERYQRGQEFGELWLSWNPTSNGRLAWRMLKSVLPIRLTSQLFRVGRNAARAGMLRAYILTLPVVASGLYCWLLGEVRAYSIPSSPNASE